MAMSLVCGRAQLLRLLRPQHSFHRVAGSPRPLATQLPVAALLGSGRPPYALLAALRPRCISTSAAFFAEAQVQPPPVVPAPPAPPAGPEVAAGGTTDVVQCAAEQSFSELGLGSYTPVGLLQNLLEFMHIDMGLPWWGAIMTCTVLARCLAFPLIVKGQREAAKIHNHLPMLQKFSIQIRDAKLAGDHIEFYRASLEMTSYQKKHDISFLRPLILPLTQAPLFLSFFLALKEMANLPVPSLQTGGLWWFQDLSVSDPMYALPLVVAVTMWTVIELGAETGTRTAEFRLMKNVVRFLPIIVLPMTIHFPAAVFMYWFTSNMFSLCQLACLQIPAVRTALKIPERVVHKPDKSLPQEGFFKSFKKGWKNAEITHQLKEREYRMKNHLDLAARGPLQQTFTHNPLLKHDPTHPPNTPNSSSSSSSKPKSKPWHDTLG